MNIPNNRYFPLAIVAVFVIITWIAWNTPVIYPVKLFTVVMHETGHALTAMALGGKVKKIEVNSQQGGITQYYFRTLAGQEIPKWKQFFIASAGYIGSLIIGSILLLLAHTRVMPALPLVIGVGLIIETILFARDGFTILFCVIAIAVFGLVGLLAPHIIRGIFVKFIATVSCCYAIFDIRDDILRFGDAQRTGSDAHALQEITGIPYYVWGAIWIIISLFIIYKVLKFIIRDKTVKEAPAPPSQLPQV